MASVLFVCLGNICRSPAGEAVFNAIVEQRASAPGGLAASAFRVDSCGTGGGNPDWYCPGGWSYHEGDKSDSRMTKEARKRGYTLTSRARPLTKRDIDEFDYIICMEDKNRNAVLEAAQAWGGAACKELAAQKVTMMTSYCTKFKSATRVPDPWYEGGFDHVLDLLEDACAGLYESILEKNDS
ncbi:Protein tyrosine phosphatase, partial [Globisporangium splendens]